jgi:digeranylgeranylglycerophospholipid reductase
MTSVAENVDVLIIGFGPAGSCAAASAARAGLRVLAIEKKSRVGIPVQCAEFIPGPMAGSARQAAATVQRVHGMNTVLPSDMSHWTAFPGLMIDRARFDQGLAQIAVGAGAILWESSHLRWLDPGERTAGIFRFGQQRQVRFGVMIAADGPLSTVASLLRLPPLKTVATRQYTVSLLEPTTDTEVWLSDDYPGGYAWLFPKLDCANLGLGMDSRVWLNPKASLDHLHRQLVSRGRVGPSVLSRTGGAIPVGGLRMPLVLRSILFAGDAAGLANPVTGAGVPAAVVSGYRAGDAAVEYVGGAGGRALSDYEEDIREQFQVSLGRALRRRALLERSWQRLGMCDERGLRRGWIAFKEYFEADAC